MGVPENAKARRRAKEDVALLSCTNAEPFRQREEPVTHLVIGQVQSARGVGGELRVTILSDAPERFKRLDEVYLGDARKRFRVERGRVHQGKALLKLEGITNRNAAEAWCGAYVYVPIEDAVPLEEGEYYHYQIEGLTVATSEGEKLGRVTEILVTGANDVYVVQGEAGEILLPAIKDVILHIDLEASLMTVRVLEGLR